MPRYDFRCPEHGLIELISGFDKPLGDTQPCTICSREMKRVFHSAGIIFKGSGFYRIDSQTTGDD